MKKHEWFFVWFMLAVPLILRGQTASEMESLLAVEVLNYEEAAWTVLTVAETSEFRGFHDAAGPEGAFSYAANQQWLPRNALRGGETSLEEVSLLIMKAFNIKGGILYSIFENPHFAYRELVYRDVIQGRADPEMTVSGELLFFMLNRLLSKKETDAEFDIAKERDRRLAALKEEQPVVGFPTIQFLPNSALLTETEKVKLREIARMLETVPQRNIVITGHTALAGTEQARMETSLSRARMVADYLVFLGARKADEIFIKGCGAERPLADNSLDKGMVLNRRVEISIAD